MVFRYSGDVAEIREDAAAIKEVVNARYREILGEERYAKLDEMSSRLLVPECYFSSRDQLRKRLHQELPERACNKFLIALDGDFKLDKDGRLSQGKIRTAPAFYIAPEAFQFSGGAKVSNRQIASYIHEFNHFVQYALQHPPLYLAQHALLEEAREAGKSVDISEFMMKVIKEDASTPEKRIDMTKRIITYSLAHLLKDAFEGSNDIMDQQILDSIGMRRELEWRGKPKQYYPIPTPMGIMVALPGGGDPFRGLSDREVIDKILNWPETFNLRAPIPYFHNLFDSLKTVKVSRMPLPEFMEFARRQE